MEEKERYDRGKQVRWKLNRNVLGGDRDRENRGREGGREGEFFPRVWNIYTPVRYESDITPARHKSTSITDHIRE